MLLMMQLARRLEAAVAAGWSLTILSQVDVVPHMYSASEALRLAALPVVQGFAAG
jgi:hypothetical protein